MRSWIATARLLIDLGWEIGPGLFTLYTAVTMSAVISPLLAALGVRPLVDGAVAGDTGQVVAGGIAVAVALTLVLTAPIGYRWATIRMRERSGFVAEQRVLRLATTAPRIEHLERPEFLDRLQTVKREAPELANSVTVPFVGLLVMAQLAVSTILLAQLQPILAVLPIIAIPALSLSRRAEAVRRRAELAAAPHRRLAQKLFATSVDPAAAQELHVAALGNDLLARHRDATQQANAVSHAALFRSVAIGAAGWALFPIAYAAALLLIVREALAGRVSPGDVALTLALAGAVISAATRILDVAGSARQVRTTAEHYLWLEAQAEGEPGKEPSRTTLRSGIEFKQVSFAYGPHTPALEDINLTLPAGSTVAIVGENGAGKSTLVKLLTGLYRPTQGEIEVDGTNLADLDLSEYRRRITAGFQDFVRYQLTAREAVAVGGLDEPPERVRAALTAAEATFVDDLPHGPDTQLGTAWRDGVDLSGGQWQKLAIARALVRPDPFLVIMDEPSAALDPHSEAALFDNLIAAAKGDGRITVLVTHRFSTVRAADLVVVLEHGRLTELGSHAELLAGNGTYAELYRLQAAGYQ